MRRIRLDEAIVFNETIDVAVYAKTNKGMYPVMIQPNYRYILKKISFCWSEDDYGVEVLSYPMVEIRVNVNGCWTDVIFNVELSKIKKIFRPIDSYEFLKE